MSQDNVERVIGRLVTDEAFRRRFADSPQEALLELLGDGMALTRCELRALGCLDARRLSSFADAIDPRLQKTDLEGGAS